MSAPKFMAIHQVSDVIFQPHHCHMHRHHIRVAINHKNNSLGPRLNVWLFYFFFTKLFLCGLAFHPHADRFYVTKNAFLACPF